jgi:hypothetical protein
VLRSISQRLTYANVMSTFAVFLALGGISYAALKLPKNSVGSAQIKTGAVTNAKLAKGAVTAAKIKGGSLTGALIAPGSLSSVLFAPGSLTGTQVNASTLGTVPQASHAADADQLGGASPSAYQARVSGICSGNNARSPLSAPAAASRAAEPVATSHSRATPQSSSTASPAPALAPRSPT